VRAYVSIHSDGMMSPFALFMEVPSTLEITRRGINDKYDEREKGVGNEEKRR
jgi:hypothetical protein